MGNLDAYTGFEKWNHKLWKQVLIFFLSLCLLDTDLVVIGSGPGGYVAAIKAAQLGLKVFQCFKTHLSFTLVSFILADS